MADYIPILVAIITGILSLAGVIITNESSNRSIENKLAISQAVTDTKLDNLTEEVRKHNNFAQEIPVIKVEISKMQEDIKGLKAVKNG